MTTEFSYVSKEEVECDSVEEPFFLLILHRSDLIAKKKRSFFFNIRGRMYVVMCLLIIFGVVITNKTRNFTTRSGRD